MDLETASSNAGMAKISRRTTFSLRGRCASPPVEASAKSQSACVCAGLAPWQLARVRRYIERHLGSRLTNSALAALVQRNEDHFARAFKKSVGCPPHAYIVQRRVEHAKLLLMGSNLRLCQIALATGFSDQAHLSRRFRETVGASPASWQRQSRRQTR